MKSLLVLVFLRSYFNKVKECRQFNICTDSHRTLSWYMCFWCLYAFGRLSLLSLLKLYISRCYTIIIRPTKLRLAWIFGLCIIISSKRSRAITVTFSIVNILGSCTNSLPSSQLTKGSIRALKSRIVRRWVLYVLLFVNFIMCKRRQTANCMGRIRSG